MYFSKVDCKMELNKGTPRGESFGIIKPPQKNHPQKTPRVTTFLPSFPDDLCYDYFHQGSELNEIKAAPAHRHSFSQDRH